MFQSHANAPKTVQIAIRDLEMCMKRCLEALREVSSMINTPAVILNNSSSSSSSSSLISACVMDIETAACCSSYLSDRIMILHSTFNKFSVIVAAVILLGFFSIVHVQMSRGSSISDTLGLYSAPTKRL